MVTLCRTLLHMKPIKSFAIVFGQFGFLFLVGCTNGEPVVTNSASSVQVSGVSASDSYYIATGLSCKQPLKIPGKCDQRITDFLYSVDGGKSYSPVNSISTESDGDCHDGQFRAEFTDICKTFGVKTGEEVDKVIYFKGRMASGESAPSIVKVFFNLNGQPIKDKSFPSILSITSSSANKAYSSGGQFDVRVKFSEVVKISVGSPRFALNITNLGVTFKYANYVSGTGTDELVFRYTVVPGDKAALVDQFDTSSFDANGSTITDVSGNLASLTLPPIGSGKTFGEMSSIQVDTSVKLATSSISVGPSITANTTVIANGGATGTLSLVMRDLSGNPVTGLVPTYTVSGSSNTASACPATDASGRTSCTFYSTKAETKKVKLMTPFESSEYPIIFVPGNPTVIAKNSGDTQTAIAGSSLANPLRVLVTDANSNPVILANIKWTVIAGAGSLSGVSSKTDSNGIAEILYTVGTAAGSNNNSVDATIDGTSTKVTFTASVLPKTTIAALEWGVAPAANHTANNLTPMTSFSLKLKDSYGNLINTDNSSQVTLSRTIGSGSLGGTLIRTASSGIVTFNDITYTKAEDIKVRASAGAITLDSVAVTHVAPGPVSASKSTLTTSGSSISTDSSAKATITARLLDDYINPVENVAVTLQVNPNTGATLVQPSANTNSLGQASGTIASTKAEKKTISILAPASLNSLSVDVTFVSTAAVASQSSITGTDNILADGVSQSDIVITLKDKDDNPVMGQMTGFQATDTDSKNVIGSCPLTDINGQSRCTLASTRAEIKTISISSPFTKIGPGIKFLPGPAAKISKVGGDGQSARAGTSLSDTLKVLVTDSNDNPVKNKQVNWTKSATGSAFGGSVNTMTDNLGLTQIGYSVGTITGSNNNPVEATIDGTATKVSFNASVKPGSVLGSLAWDTLPPVTHTASNVTFLTAFSAKLKDSYGNFMDDNNVSSVSVQLKSGSGTGTLTGTLSKTAMSGIVTFSDLKYTKAESIILEANSGGISLFSAPLVVSAGAVSDVKSTLIASPTNPGVGSSSSLVLTLSDSYNNPIQGQSVSFTAASADSTLTQPGSATDAAGKATGSVTSEKPGNQVVSLTSYSNVKATLNFAVGASDLANSSFSIDEVSVVANGTSVANLRIQLKDPYSNPISGITPTLSIISGTNGNTLSSCSSTDLSGNSSCTLKSTRAEIKTLKVLTPSSLSSKTASVTFVHGPANRLTFQTQPGGATAGQAFTSQPQVAIVDAEGNVVNDGPDATAMVDMTLTSGSGILLGGFSSPAVAGIVNWSNLAIDAQGPGKVLQATKMSTLASAGGTGSLSMSSAVFNNAANPPPVPSGLTINAGTAIDLSWSASVGATSYNILRGTSAGNLAFIASSTTPSYRDTTGTAGTVYFYGIQSESVAGTSITSTSKSAKAIGAFSISSANFQTPDAIRVSWNAASGAESYEVKYGTSAGTYSTTLNVGLVTQYLTPTLAGGDYYFMVVAKNSTGDGASVNANAEIKGTIPLLMPPTGISLSSPQSSPSVNNRPTFLITGVDNGDTVKLYRDSCSTEVGSAVAAGNSVLVSLSTAFSSAGVYSIQAKRSNAGSDSPCTAADVSYDYSPLKVEPTYSAAQNWSYYIKYDEGAKDLNHQSNDACVGTETAPIGMLNGCIHGGERRKVVMTGYASCNGLSLNEELGAFVWEPCTVDAGTAVFYSRELASGKGLRDLIMDTGSWKGNQITINAGGVDIAQTKTTDRWFSNPIRDLALTKNNSNSTSVLDLTENGAIYMVGATSLATFGYRIPANTNNVSIVSLGNSQLSKYDPSNSDNFKASDCGTGPVLDTDSILCLKSIRFSWIEVRLRGIAAGDTHGATTAIIAEDVKFSRIHNSSAVKMSARNSDPSLRLDNFSSNLITGFDIQDAGAGVRMTSISEYNIVRNLSLAQISYGSGPVQELYVGKDNKFNRFLDLRLNRLDSINSGSQALQVAGDNNYFSRINISNVKGQGTGIALVCVSGVCPQGNIFSQAAISSTEDAAIRFDGIGINNNLFMNVTTINNAKDSVVFKGGSGPDNTYTNNLFLSFVAANSLNGVTSDSNKVGGSGNRFLDIYIANGETGFDIIQTTLATVGSPGTSVTIGQLTTPCTASGVDFCQSATPGGDLSNSFVGKVVTDDRENSSDTLGAASNPSDIGGLLRFESIFRSWGKDGSGFPDADNRGYSAENQRIWDLSPRNGGNLSNRSYNGRDANGILNDDGAPCAAKTVAASDNIVFNGVTFLRNAIEIDGDGVGNDNGICESGESCVWAPNLGADQGSGAISQGYCTVNSGPLTNIRVYHR